MTRDDASRVNIPRALLWPRADPPRPFPQRMIEELLPATARAAEAFTDPPQARLFAEEEPLVARAVESRRREFTTGRWCARRALRELDVPDAPLLADERRAPRWPDGIIGSITHCAGYRAAVVARADPLRWLGIDAEVHEPLPDGVLDVVSLPAERTALERLSGPDPETAWDRVLFSCKEAVFKAWYPLTRAWLDFQEAEIQLAPGHFRARLLRPGPIVAGAELTGFEGRWLARDGLVLSATIGPS